MSEDNAIPKAAIDAATKAIHRYDWVVGLSSTFAPNAHHREEARLALEAAAPYMTATRPGIGG